MVLAYFVAAAGILWAFEQKVSVCVGNPVECWEWGAGNPLIEGYCCMKFNSSQAVGCSGTEVMAYVPSAMRCGRLTPITFSGECSFGLTAYGCGGGMPTTGCISRDCPSLTP